MSPSSRQANRAAVSGIIKLVLRNASTIQGTLKTKAVLRTVKFSTVLVNSLCFDLNFTLRAFTKHAFVLNCCHVVLEDGFVVPR